MLENFVLCNHAIYVRPILKKKFANSQQLASTATYLVIFTPGHVQLLSLRADFANRCFISEFYQDCYLYLELASVMAFNRIELG